MRVIARAHASTRATSLMGLKNSTRHFCLCIYCLGYWNEENEKTKTSNWIDDHFPLTFANISFTWMLYIHVWFQNKGKILIWWEYYNQCGIYQRSRISLLEPRQNSLSIVCSYHVTYAFQSESTLYSCLSVKERLAQNRRDIWSWSDCNGPRTHNHLVRKQTSDIEPVWSKEFLDT